MGNAKTTADRYYYMEEKIMSTERAEKLLSKTMRMVAEEKNDRDKIVMKM